MSFASLDRWAWGSMNGGMRCSRVRGVMTDVASCMTRLSGLSESGRANETGRSPVRKKSLSVLYGIAMYTLSGIARSSVSCLEGRMCLVARQVVRVAHQRGAAVV